ncbi:tRNA lysidine(34) synthetase TilS [Paracoccus sp. (in: a-proteobacteria)]|uniref:tRNA lysidine(34) synthetase TilS n=1 Tax=Paracoccus sp. TaxID=267 RepID=UPI0035AF6AE8
MRARPDKVETTVHAALDRLAGSADALGIALSGGGDSIAMMHLVQGWAGGRRLMAATVDHGLRPGSADEARQAGQAAEALGIGHETLFWRRGDQGASGNLMADARLARLRLLSDWARGRGLAAVLLGHTRDDQAETLVMRLGRGAGIDGLSGMAATRRADGMVWLRPMLGVGRADLRDWLRARGIGWTDDPSNDNDAFDRVRARKALAALDLPLPQLAQVAENLSMARDALCAFAAQVAEGAQARHAALALPLAPFRAAPTEIRRRLLVAGLRFVSGADYPPRRAAVLHLLEALQNDAPGSARLTLDGVIAQVRGGALCLIREPRAAAISPAASPDAQGGAIWDRRWRVAGLRPGQQVRALGYAPLPGLDWRATGMGRDEAAASPAIWSGDDLVAAPLIRDQAGIRATPLRGVGDFGAMLYTH